ncbi:cell division protein FtsX [Mariprofundus ferrinatatus]|uniref:Cell division protein FtsX n=1 Tax=Mariprofundus ferrinatatus TaxID=1921087 RepID=A0A2K8LC80_9PROT|nr:permease-like cell division protein FtsX [Mariprofundus ferrinatatus]ATX82504.1 cell division protein FtsX [Mariprofundus ferrinatatus]
MKKNSANELIPEKVNPRLPGGFHLPPFGIHQTLAVIIVCIALWAVGAIWLGVQAASQWVGGWQDDIHVHVYLDNSKSAQEEELASALESIPQVSSVRRISQAEAARWMQEWLDSAGLSQKELAERLPITFELSINDEKAEFLFTDIRDAAMRYGGEVNESEVSMAKAHEWISRAEYLALFASLILALAMALIISNTLRMMLLARADEIHLMRLMGAKEWFVRMPFILEGMLLGGVAGIAAWLMLWPLILGGEEWLGMLQVDLNAWVLLPPLLLGGALVGAFGAVVATARVVSTEHSG